MCPVMDCCSGKVGFPLSGGLDSPSGHSIAAGQSKIPMQMRLERLLNAYSHSYEIIRDVRAEGSSFPAAAFFFLRDEHYLVRRDMQLYATEQHEYVYFAVADHLDVAGLQRQIDLSLKAGLAQVKPHKEHMCSYVTLVILAETLDTDAKKLLKRTHYHKNFRFGFYGWMDYHIAAMECSTMRFFSNPGGREARRTLENNFGSRENKRRERVHE